MNEFAKLLGLDDLKSNLDNKAKNVRRNNGKGCVLCNYTGYLTTADNKSKMCDCEKKKFLYEIYQAANIPPIYFDKTFDDWNTKADGRGNDLGMQQSVSENVFMLLNFYEEKMLDICTDQNIKVRHSGNCIDRLHSIKFEGNNNSGKTFIGSVMVQSAIRKNLSAKYYDWIEIMETIMDFNKKDELDEILNDFKNKDFIAIDGVEHYNFNHSQLPMHIDRLAKARLNSGKPTFILGNNSISLIQAGSGWQSLLKSCLTVRLPNVIK